MFTFTPVLQAIEREAKERQAELVARLSKVEGEGERLGQEVARLAASDDHDDHDYHIMMTMMTSMMTSMMTLMVTIMNHY